MSPGKSFYIGDVSTNRTYGTTLTWKFILTKTTENFVKDVGEILNKKKDKNIWKTILKSLEYLH